MPTIATMRIYAPKDWSEFQDITTSALRIKWSSPNIQQYGRQGQAQQGVDIFGQDHLGRASGIQCKRQDTLEEDAINDEVTKAESFKPTLDNYYFAIAGPRDAKLQQLIRLISEKRLAASKFPVGIFFWDDLIEEVAKSPLEFQKHYPQISLNLTPVVDPTQQALAAYDASYYGSDIRDTIDLIFGEFGVMANENPMQLDHMMLTIEASTERLMPQDKHQHLVAKSRQLVKTTLDARKGKAEWHTVDSLGQDIEVAIKNLLHSTSGIALAGLDLGFVMKRWEYASYNFPQIIANEVISRIEVACRALELSEDTLEALKGDISVFNLRDDFAPSKITRLPWKWYQRIKSHIISKCIAG